VGAAENKAEGIQAMRVPATVGCLVGARYYKHLGHVNGNHGHLHLLTTWVEISGQWSEISGQWSTRAVGYKAGARAQKLLSITANDKSGDVSLVLLDADRLDCGRNGTTASRSITLAAR